MIIRRSRNHSGVSLWQSPCQDLCT